MTSSRVVIASGPRAAEARLLRELGSIRACSPADLAVPVRVVVPSRSLRLHVGRRLVAHGGGAVAGVTVQTLYGLALEVLERRGEPPPRGASTWELLVRRVARAEPALARDLDRLDDGYAAVVATVRDLLDAGLEPAHADALLEQLGELRGGALAVPVAERAAALVRVAAAAAGEAEALGAARASSMLRRAAETLAQVPDATLPARRVFLHGFADATGVAGDLIVALLRHRPTVLLLDRPLDPVDGSDAAGTFSRAFTERVRGAAESDPEEEAAPPPARVTGLVAKDLEAEVREVVEQVARCLEGGSTPEDVGLVARSLEPCAAAIRRHCERLGVPYSGVGGTVPGGAQRSVARSLARLLETGPRAPVEVWLEATASCEREAAEVALALRTLGVARLRDVAGALASGGVVLPVVGGWSPGDHGDEVRARRRRVPGTVLARWAERAARACDTCAAWPDTALAAVHLERSLDLLPAGDGGERPAADGAVRQALEAAAADLPAGLVIDRPEWVLLARHALERVGSEPAGGLGGGVQVLDVMEARGRTFAHLFVLGLNRDSFPRAVSEDPLLPDEVRLRLAPLLPDIPVKERGWDEERFLFAQVVAAASVGVTLSWHASQEGRATAPSPLVVRLGLGSGTVIEAPDPDQRPRTAFDRVVAPEVAGCRKAWRGVLEVALVEGRGRFRSPTLRVAAKRLAAARAELLEELDPESPRPGLGPFSGCVGPPTGHDPRRRLPYVTLLEGVAWCPWQAFLARLLQVEAVPDPLVELPTADHLLVGNTVHGVLERLVGERTGPRADLAEVVRRQAEEVAWPAGGTLARLLRAAAREAVAEAGLAGSGVEALVEVLARPYLDVAGQLEWGGGIVPALGAEVTGRVELDLGGVRRRLGFRADRVDRAGGGEVRLTDYKTGKAVGPRRIVTEVQRGLKLQGVAYCLAGPPDGSWVGRYAFISPEAAVAREVSASDTAQVRAFLAAVEVLLEALDRGAFPPRLVTPPGGSDSPPCRTCQVRDACLKGDSGFRGRLVEWTTSPPGDDPLERAAHALWWLGWTPRQDGAVAEVEVDE